MNIKQHRTKWINEKPLTRNYGSYAKWLGFDRQNIEGWVKGIIPRLPTILKIKERTGAAVSEKDWGKK